MTKCYTCVPNNVLTTCSTYVRRWRGYQPHYDTSDCGGLVVSGDGRAMDHTPHSPNPNPKP